MKYFKSLLSVVFIMIINTLYSQNFLGKFNSVGEMCTLGSTVYFVANDGKNGFELWKTDGTIDGTVMVKDINMGYNGSDPANLTAFNNELYFSANDGIYGIELWKSDGTSKGTALLKNIKPETTQYDNSSGPTHFIVFKNAIYFTAADEWTNADIWKTDGTVNGTVKFYESEFLSISKLIVVKDALFFITYSGSNQLFVTDGTTGGTHMIPIDDYYSIEELTRVNNKLFFITSTSYRQNFRLYALNPDDDTFIRLRDYNSVLYGSNNIANMTAVNDDLYYSIQTDNNTDYYSDVLWKSNGTVSGTDTIRSFTYNPYWSGSNMTDFVNYNNKLYFRGNFSGKYTFCESDGTYTGTREVTSINLDSKGLQFTNCDNMLYFTGFSNSGMNIVWKSDGTSTGTASCEAINAGIGQSAVRLHSSNEKLYYIPNHGYSTSLWNNTAKPGIQVLNGYYALESGQQITFNANASNPIVNHPLKIKNTGTADLFISRLQTDGGNFYINVIDQVIPPNESRSLNVTFYPVKDGIQEGKLKIYSNDIKESCFVINLTGTSVIANNTSGILDKNISLNQSTGLVSFPDTLILSNSSIPENQPVNSIIGSLNLRIPNLSGFVCSLVSGQGDEDNNLFYLTDNILYSNKIFDFETKSTCVIRVRATNNMDSTENFLVIRVTDMNEPITGECTKQFYNMSYSLNDVEFLTDSIVFSVGGNGTILKSEDSGNNWIRINSGTQSDLNSIQFVSDKVGYILGSYNNVFLKTENGGNNWFPQDLKYQGYPFASNFYFINEETGFVAGGDGKILKTINGGRTWSIRDEGYNDFSSVFFVNEQTGYVCGQSNKVIKTTDGGASWKTINMDTFGYNTSFNDIWFTNEQTGYVLSSNGKVIKTTDGGQTWLQAFNANMDYMSHIYFVNENIGYIIGSWSSTAIFKTMDAGVTWEADNTNYSRGSLMGISFNTNGSKGIMVGAGTSLGSTSEAGQIMLRTDDSGSTWQNNSLLSGDSDFRDVEFINDSTGYIIDDYGSVAKTHDGGNTWQQLNNHTDGSFIECHYLSADTIFMVTTTEVRSTFDGGTSWKTVPGFPGWAFYCFLDYNQIFYCKNGNIYKSDNAGQTWTAVYIKNEWFNFSKIISYNNKTIIALALDGIVTSRDGGATWSTCLLSNYKFLEAVYFKDENNILAGGQGGLLYKTTDGGLNWIRQYTSITYDIKKIYFFDENNGIVLSNGGLHSTSDGGTTWLQFYSISEQCRDFCVTNNNDIYISGSSGYFNRYSKGSNPSAAGYITGDDFVCRNTGSNYEAVPLPLGKYTWEVIPYQEITFVNNKATVNWSEPGLYQVKATPENGCGTGIASIISVLVQDVPEALITGDDSVSRHETAVTYLSNQEPNVLVNWQIQGADKQTVSNENEIVVNWGTFPSGMVSLVHTSTETGCRQIASLFVTILSSTGTNEVLKQLDVEVYPNPTSAKLFIKLAGQDKKLIVSLYSESGELLIANEIGNKLITEINMEKYCSGVYILKISSDTVNTALKVIKQ